MLSGRPTQGTTARSGELLSRVWGGRTSMGTDQGKDLTALRPVTESDGTAATVLELESRGLLTPVAARLPLRPLARRPGALKRFLEERD